MPAPILPILPVSLSSIPAPAASPAGSGGGAFASVFSHAVNQVEAFQQNAQQSIDRFLSGEGEDLHKVALASTQADLSFQLFMQARNKVVSAYQEVMKMQI
jgi:flagellar hook-basal body complex protein FliE